MNKKIITFSSVALTALVFASPVYAAAADVTSIQTFIKSIIQILVTLAALISAGFFVWGGFVYITSSGNPEQLDRAKKTILYSAVGLAIVFGAFVLTNVISDLATTAFGAMP